LTSSYCGIAVNDSKNGCFNLHSELEKYVSVDRDLDNSENQYLNLHSRRDRED
jgi:hypothetical protein